MRYSYYFIAIKITATKQKWWGGSQGKEKAEPMWTEAQKRFSRALNLCSQRWVCVSWVKRREGGEVDGNNALASELGTGDPVTLSGSTRHPDS